MTNKKSYFNANLFYSYCHKDAVHREAMEKSLALLKRNGLLSDWSDRNILPGRKISEEIKKKIDGADIMVFLFSPDFIASDACIEEWRCAQKLKDKGKPIFRIPIILRDCAWQDVLVDDDIKALPEDGKAITAFGDEDQAWQQVYKGIKAVIDVLKNTFTPKPEFLGEMGKTDFLSQHSIHLKDIFIFLRLSCYGPEKEDGVVQDSIIKNPKQLLKKEYILVHGEEMSGKTALGRYLFFYLAEEISAPVLHIDLKETSGKAREEHFIHAYRKQFNGDYLLWRKQNNKTLILDNLDGKVDLGFIDLAKTFFERIIIILSSDIFSAFFRDEMRLADFHEMKIEPLTHKQQETLIRKRLKLSDRSEPVTDGFVDQIENRINSVIISSRIVPRYPFYVLSILQTYEEFMPENLSITSYGHCYYVLILANLIKSGISRRDSDINSCFNFAEHLAFGIYQEATLNYDEFVQKYKEKFHIQDSILSRLKNPDHGILDNTGRFKKSYAYYFFLGRFLSKESDVSKNTIERMCENSHISSNYLTLLFIIHHTNSDQIVDDILLRTICTLENIQPAQLNKAETKKFGEIIASLPEQILSSDSVEIEREKERGYRDTQDHQSDLKEESENSTEGDPTNDFYRIFKNNAIMGQILRNKYGNLEKAKIEEIIETIADSGLRLVNYLLENDEEINDLAHYIHTKYPEHNIEGIRRFLQSVLFIWTMHNIEKVVSSINFPEIRESIHNVVCKKSTPAYDLIGYFSQLDSADHLTDGLKKRLSDLLKKHDDFFIKRVLSIRTQLYMNTHRSKTPVKQSIHSLLGISPSPKYRRGKK